MKEIVGSIICLMFFGTLCYVLIKVVNGDIEK